MLNFNQFDYIEEDIAVPAPNMDTSSLGTGLESQTVGDSSDGGAPPEGGTPPAPPVQNESRNRFSIENDEDLSEEEENQLRQQRILSIL
jgi:hypothetical protein